MLCAALAAREVWTDSSADIIKNVRRNPDTLGKLHAAEKALKKQQEKSYVDMDKAAEEREAGACQATRSRSSLRRCFDHDALQTSWAHPSKN